MGNQPLSTLNSHPKGKIRDDRGPQRISYGWAIVAAMFLMQMLTVGSTSYGFGLLVKPISAEYGLSRADVNIGLMLLLVGLGVSSPIIGRALDKISARIVVVGGALIFGIGAISIAVSSSLILMAAATFFLLAVGAAALGPLTASTLTARWFDRGRGRALGIISVATSFGGLGMVPLMAVLIEKFGWRTTVASIGVTVALLVSLIGILVVRERQDWETSLSGSMEAPGTSLQRCWTVSELLHTRDFWLIALSIGILMGIDQALLASLIAYGTDRGFSLQAAALLISAVSVSAVVGKLLVGALSDHIDIRWLIVVVAALTEIFLATLLSQPGYTALVVGSLVAGMAIGGTAPLWAAIIGARFGVRSYGTAMGLMLPVQMPLIVGGVHYIGSSFDKSGNYTQAFMTFMIVALIAAGAIVPVKLRRR